MFVKLTNEKCGGNMSENLNDIISEEVKNE